MAAAAKPVLPQEPEIWKDEIQILYNNYGFSQPEFAEEAGNCVLNNPEQESFERREACYQKLLDYKDVCGQDTVCKDDMPAELCRLIKEKNDKCVLGRIDYSTTCCYNKLDKGHATAILYADERKKNCEEILDALKENRKARKQFKQKLRQEAEMQEEKEKELQRNIELATRDEKILIQRQKKQEERRLRREKERQEHEERRVKYEERERQIRAEEERQRQKAIEDAEKLKILREKKILGKDYERILDAYEEQKIIITESKRLEKEILQDCDMYDMLSKEGKEIIQIADKELKLQKLKENIASLNVLKSKIEASILHHQQLIGKVIQLQQSIIPYSQNVYQIIHRFSSGEFDINEYNFKIFEMEYKTVRYIEQLTFPQFKFLRQMYVRLLNGPMPAKEFEEYRVKAMRLFISFNNDQFKLTNGMPLPFLQNQIKKIDQSLTLENEVKHKQEMWQALENYDLVVEELEKTMQFLEDLRNKYSKEAKEFENEIFNNCNVLKEEFSEMFKTKILTSLETFQKELRQANEKKLSLEAKIHKLTQEFIAASQKLQKNLFYLVSFRAHTQKMYDKKIAIYLLPDPLDSKTTFEEKFVKAIDKKFIANHYFNVELEKLVLVFYLKIYEVEDKDIKNVTNEYTHRVKQSLKEILGREIQDIPAALKEMLNLKGKYLYEKISDLYDEFSKVFAEIQQYYDLTLERLRRSIELLKKEDRTAEENQEIESLQVLLPETKESMSDLVLEMHDLESEIKTWSNDYFYWYNCVENADPEQLEDVRFILKNSVLRSELKPIKRFNVDKIQDKLQITMDLYLKYLFEMDVELLGYGNRFSEFKDDILQQLEQREEATVFRDTLEKMQTLKSLYDKELDQAMTDFQAGRFEKLDATRIERIVEDIEKVNKIFQNMYNEGRYVVEMKLEPYRAMCLYYKTHEREQMQLLKSEIENASSPIDLERLKYNCIARGLRDFQISEIIALAKMKNENR